MAQDHRISPATPISADVAVEVARSMQALATASRVRLLGRLREGPCSVGVLAESVDMEQPAVSHQLRILRDLGLVVGTRSGRHTVYALHDPHVSTLLDEALRHVEHLVDDRANGSRTRSAEQPTPTPRSDHDQRA